MQVTLDYLFSKNDLIGSKVISWGTAHLDKSVDADKVPSHVAILVNNKWVFESTLDTGVRRIFYEKWKEINTEVAKYRDPRDLELSYVLDYYRSIKAKKYDYLGLVYFGYRVALSKLFRVSIPTKNRLGRDDMYFCCEVIGEMLKLDYEMTAPVQVMVKTKKLLDQGLIQP